MLFLISMRWRRVSHEFDLFRLVDSDGGPVEILDPAANTNELSFEFSEFNAWKTTRTIVVGEKSRAFRGNHGGEILSPVMTKINVSPAF